MSKSCRRLPHPVRCIPPAQCKRIPPTGALPAFPRVTHSVRNRTISGPGSKEMAKVVITRPPPRSPATRAHTNGTDTPKEVEWSRVVQWGGKEEEKKTFLATCCQNAFLDLSFSLSLFLSPFTQRPPLIPPFLYSLLFFLSFSPSLPSVFSPESERQTGRKCVMKRPYQAHCPN